MAVRAGARVVTVERMGSRFDVLVPNEEPAEAATRILSEAMATTAVPPKPFKTSAPRFLRRDFFGRSSSRIANYVAPPIDPTASQASELARAVLELLDQRKQLHREIEELQMKKDSETRDSAAASDSALQAALASAAAARAAEGAAETAKTAAESRVVALEKRLADVLAQVVPAVAAEQSAPPSGAPAPAEAALSAPEVAAIAAPEDDPAAPAPAPATAPPIESTPALALSEGLTLPAAVEQDEATDKWDLVAWVESAGVHRVIAAALKRGLITQHGVDEDAFGDQALACVRGLNSREELAKLLRTTALIEGITDIVWSSVQNLQAAGAETNEELQSKFAGAIEMSYSGLDTFFGGMLPSLLERTVRCACLTRLWCGFRQLQCIR